MTINDEQRVALELCDKWGICFEQNGDWGSTIEADLDRDSGWYYGHEDLISVAPFVRRLIVIVRNNVDKVAFGLECVYPTDHYHGNFCGWRRVDGNDINYRLARDNYIRRKQADYPDGAIGIWYDIWCEEFDSSDEYRKYFQHSREELLEVLRLLANAYNIRFEIEEGK